MENKKAEIINGFLAKYVFVPQNSADSSWVDGVADIVKLFIADMKDPTIQSVLDFFTVSGDLDKIETYQKIREFVKGNNQATINCRSTATELSYLKTMIGCINQYKHHRQVKIEKAYEFCASKGIDVWTLTNDDKNLEMVEEIYNSLPSDMDEMDKIFHLRLNLRRLNRG